MISKIVGLIASGSWWCNIDANRICCSLLHVGCFVLPHFDGDLVLQGNQDQLVARLAGFSLAVDPSKGFEEVFTPVKDCIEGQSGRAASVFRGALNDGLLIGSSWGAPRLLAVTGHGCVYALG